MKKMVFILIDSIIPKVLEKCLHMRSVPALQFLASRGQLNMSCVSSFPTMTSVVDSSLLTGGYADQHHIPGLVWYDGSSKQIINYMNGLHCVWRQGVRQCAQHALLNINQKHLNAHQQTLFEELSASGLRSASINWLIHRGNTPHKMKLKRWQQTLTGIKNGQPFMGADIVTLGTFAYPEYMNQTVRDMPLKHWKRLGFNDRFAITAFKKINQTDQPDLTMIYLPDQDQRVHAQHPNQSILPLIRADRRIQSLLNTYASWEEALKENIWVVTSDHGQTYVGNNKHYNINLDELLGQYDKVQPGEQVHSKHQIVICNNERMSYIYPLQVGTGTALISDLEKESRIDLIAWKNDHEIIVSEGGTKRRLIFSPHGTYEDPYGQTWDIYGDHNVLDLYVTSDHKIRFGAYPDALARLYGALYAQKEDVIVITARPRYEFATRYHPQHNHGGSHGSLHEWDSLVPFVVAGDDTHTPLPPRLVDCKDYIVQVLQQHQTMVKVH